jgi:hypothetical protein
VLARLAEAAAHRAADLRGHAEAIARQIDAFEGVPGGETQEPATRAVGRGMALDLHDERVEASRERGQRREERVREAAGTRARRIVEREAAQPAREDRGHVERARADVAQVLAQLGDGSQGEVHGPRLLRPAVGRLLGGDSRRLAARRGRATLRHSEAPW